MSSYGRNLSLGSQNNARDRSFSSRKQITCRLCDRVLYSTQALITHIESHIVQGDISTSVEQNQYRRSLIQPNNQILGPNPNFRPRFTSQSSALPLFPSSRAMQVQRPVPTRGPNLSLSLGGEYSGGAQSVDIHLSPIVPPRVSSDSRASRVGSKLLGKRPWPMVEDVVSPINGARPFLSQLDRPIPNVVGLEVGNYEDGLNLTLKL